MKIIVVYASAGSGHRRAAEAIYHCLEKRYPELTLTLVDILEYTNLWFAKFYNRGYTLLVTHLKFIWVAGYHLSSFKFVRCFSNFVGRLNSSRFIKLLLKEKPDIVLATHFFPAAVVAYLKGKAKIDSRLVTIITDFCVHPLWVFENCDDYIVGSDFTRNRLINRGINQDTVKVLGIPISSEFSIQRRQNEYKQGLVALVVTGAFGFSLIEKAVDMLFSHIRLLVVCGNNQRLYDRLARKQYIGVRLFGFTEDIHKLMSQADFIITKPGGLTITEALALELPLIFIGSIPGQETENARILESYGCAIDARNLKSLKDVIINLKTHPERLTLMRRNIKKIRKPDAAEEICRYVCSGSI